MAAVFAAALAVTAFLWSRRGRGQSGTDASEHVAGAGTGLPVVCFEYAGEELDTLTGYTSEIDVKTLRGPLLPLDDDRAVSLVVYPRENEVSSVGWELMSTDGVSIIAGEDDIGTRESGGRITALAQLPPVMDDGREYMLRVLVETGGHGQVSYYTRVSILDTEDIQAGLDFVHSFSNATFSQNESVDFIVPYLESDMSVADNEDLGYTDLKNSYAQVTWGDLYASVYGTVRTSVCETLDTGESWTGSFTLEYEMRAVDSQGIRRDYAVREYYMLRRYYIDGTIYLLLWQRETSDITDVSGEDVSGGNIRLGILSPRAREDLSDDQELEGSFAAYAYGGRLWEYCADEDRMTLVWGSPAADEDGLLPEYGRNSCRVISLDEESGDIIFAAYGVMDTVPREGRCGLSLYRYDRGEDSLNELFFIESDRPFEQMDAELSQLACAGADGTCYLFYGDAIYAIDPEDHEPRILTGGFREGSYAVSPDETRIAWAEGSGQYGYGTVYMMDLEHGLSFRALNAAYGEELEILGFSGHDLIVGRLRPSDAGTLPDGTVTAPMYSFTIYQEQIASTGESLDGAAAAAAAGAADSSGDETAADLTSEAVLAEAAYYESAGSFVSGIVSGTDHITIYRVTAQEGAVYAPYENDTLLRNGSGISSGADMLRGRMDDVCERIWYLSAFDGDAVTGDLQYDQVTRLTVASLEPLEMGAASGNSGRYYAYACGRLYGAYMTVSAAQASVYDDMGIVTDSSQNVVWTRLGSAGGSSAPDRSAASAETETETEAETGTEAVPES